MNREELLAYMDEYLKIDEIEDYGPQGLQVEAENSTIDRIALSVDTAPSVIEAAAAWQADLLLVHHGIFWGTQETITGPLGRRVRTLLKANMNLYSAHLALDAHHVVGNNAVLAKMFDVSLDEWWCPVKGTPIGVVGDAPAGMTLSEFVNQVEFKLDTKARVLACGPEEAGRVAIVSGFGADETAVAKSQGADTFLTGETSHAHFWAASDLNLNVVYAGHYATETVGLKALGQHLTEKFNLKIQFLDFPTDM
jgi:dinuclear metal center YbgI/SA1388 family protein